MKWNEKTLKFFDLSPNEIEVLKILATAKSIQKIAVESKISRTAIKYILGCLMKKDLVSELKKGKRHIYIAITQKELAALLQQAVDEITIARKDQKGVRVRTTKENEFIIHVETKEIIPAYSRIASMNKDERIQAIQHHRSYKEIVEKASSKLLAEFNDAIKKNGIILDGMLNESAYASYLLEMRSDSKKYRDSVESLEGRMADYHTFPDNLFNYDAEIWLFKATTLIINWHEEIAIEIINANMTGFLKDMFDVIKNTSKKIDHNQRMRDILSKVA